MIFPCGMQSFSPCGQPIQEKRYQHIFMQIYCISICSIKYSIKSTTFCCIQCCLKITLRVKLVDAARGEHLYILCFLSSKLPNILHQYDLFCSQGKSNVIPSDASQLHSCIRGHLREIKTTISSGNLTVLCLYYITRQFCSFNKEYRSLIKPQCFLLGESYKLANSICITNTYDLFNQKIFV